jgi:hypothetical protein
MKLSDQPPLARRTLLAGAGPWAPWLRLPRCCRAASPPPHSGRRRPGAVRPTPGYRLTEHVKQYYRTARV